MSFESSTDSFGKGNHGRIGFGAELLTQLAGVDAGLLQRARPIAAGFEHGHEAQGHARVAGIQDGQAAPPAHRAIEVVSGGRPLRQLFQRVQVQAVQPVAFRFYPGPEFRRALQEEAVEEEPGVAANRPFQLTSRECPLELGDVATHRRRVQPQVLAAGDDCPSAEHSPERVDRLVEQVSSAIFVSFRPEIPDQPVPADRVLV